MSDKEIEPVKLLKLLSKKENIELGKKLLKADDETFKLAKEIFIDSKIKFYKTPVFEHAFFNLNIIQELNTAQLKFLFSLINTELEEREKNEGR